MGGSLDFRDDDGNTPLIKAACFGSDKIVEILLDWGADVDLQNSRGNTALMLSATNLY